MTKNRLIFLPAGILFGTILALGITAIAEDSELDSGARVFPYNGVLEFNGEALNGNVDLKFGLTDEADCSDFEEEHDNVAVFAGRFAVNIGSVTGDVPTCVFDVEEIYITVAVREADSEGEYTALLGRQRIHPVPFAYWAAEGSDFRIDGNATIGGNTTIGGNVIVSGSITDPDSAVTVNDGLIVTGSTVLRGNIQDNTGALTLNDNVDVIGNLEVTGTTTLQGSIQDDTGDVTINDNLDITGNIQDSNSNNLTIDDGLIVTGGSNLQGDIQNSTGNVTIADNLRLTGNIADSNSDVTISDGLIVTGDITLQGNLTADYLIMDGRIDFEMPRTEGFDNGQTEEVLQPSSTHFCALTRVRVGDDNDEDDSTMCEIVLNENDDWVLRGQTSANEATSACAAMCFKFR